MGLVDEVVGCFSDADLLVLGDVRAQIAASFAFVESEEALRGMENSLLS